MFIKQSHNGGKGIEKCSRLMSELVTSWSPASGCSIQEAGDHEGPGKERNIQEEVELWREKNRHGCWLHVQAEERPHVLHSFDNYFLL